jgi:hypothetical protein
MKMSHWLREYTYYDTNCLYTNKHIFVEFSMAGMDSYDECAEAPVLVVVICDGHEDSQDSHSSLA